MEALSLVETASMLGLPEESAAALESSGAGVVVTERYATVSARVLVNAAIRLGHAAGMADVIGVLERVCDALASCAERGEVDGVQASALAALRDVRGRRDLVLRDALLLRGLHGSLVHPLAGVTDRVLAGRIDEVAAELGAAEAATDCERVDVARQLFAQEVLEAAVAAVSERSGEGGDGS